MRRIQKVCAFLFIFLPSIAFAQVKVQLLDQDENPISQAVISIPSEAAARDSEQIAVMDQIDKQFFPHVLIVNAGQLVQFPNSDNIRHHVYSFSEPKPFEIKLYRGTPMSPELFEKSGIVILGCNVHDQMIGYIYVANNEITALTDENGIAVLQAPESEEVQIWHARLSESADRRMSMPLTKRDDNDVWQIKVNLRPIIVKKSRKFQPKFN